jgi:PAS domain S-box-containing protein
LTSPPADAPCGNFRHLASKAHRDISARAERQPGAIRLLSMSQPGSPTPADPESHSRAVLAAALDPIITINASGVIQSASDSVLRVFGWSPAELIGRNVSVLMPEPHRSAHDGYLARYAATGRTRILNHPRRLEAVRRDGSRFPIELSVSRADIPTMAEPLFVGIIRDLTRPRRPKGPRGASTTESQDLQSLVTEQTRALEQAHLRLRLADQMASIGTLAAGLGHDMNNVLLPVRAQLNVLREASRDLYAAHGVPPDHSNTRDAPFEVPRIDVRPRDRGHHFECRVSAATRRWIACARAESRQHPPGRAPDRPAGLVGPHRDRHRQGGTEARQADRVDPAAPARRERCTSPADTGRPEPGHQRGRGHPKPRPGSVPQASAGSSEDHGAIRER